MPQPQGWVAGSSMRAVAPQRRFRVGKGLGERGRDVGKWVGGHLSAPCPVLQPGSHHRQRSELGAQGSPSFEITITRNAEDEGSQVRDAFGRPP